MKKIITFAVILGIALFAVIGFGMSISYTNKEIELKTQVEAQQKKCEAYFDKMWKILQQKAGVTDQYKNAFKDIYPKLIEGRYAKGDGSLMKWITESNPTFDVSMYKDLMQSIDIERTGFFNEQSLLIDINREHSALIQKIPAKWFLGSAKEIEIKIITSSKTEKAYETGKEDDVDLYKKDTSK